ncbi:hypothetical protein BaRGS_00005687 [Batillaria attramentaria]|uniref:Mucoidy inhibitor A n=1 Tax=Batillaria attramentaria TaxID=370345 RepID=A0ABD0LV84_9CAEN
MATNTAPDTKEKGKESEKDVVFIAPECPVEKVTVYPDRAEVCRRVEANLAADTNQVVIKKLPEMVDPDSIRVEGTGEATIMEVVFQTESVVPEEMDTSTRQKELEQELEELHRQQEDLQSELSVLRKQWGLLDSFANTASKGGSGDKEDDKSGVTPLNEAFFKGLTEFLKLYAKEGSDLEKAQLDLQRKLEGIAAKITANEENQRKLRNKSRGRHEIKQCIIVVECKAATKVTLLVSYVTSNASWIPSYDIRMYTAEDKLKITYYGQIKQSTGEDWVDAKLFLSTAQPSIGGEVPELSTAELRLRRPTPVKIHRKVMQPAPRSRPQPSLFRAAVDEVVDIMRVNIGVPLERGPPLPSDALVEYMEANVGEGGATTMYEIVRSSTIPSDNVEHKVTVGLVDIKPKISYTSVPQKTPHAFMLAKVTNSSQYTFLAGETSIFLDNTFVGKASMKDVYPMEEFDCSLGVDPAVKVTYKPLKKYRASSGIISKTVSNTHEQVIELKNNHDYAITLLLIDQLPRSADEGIKVNLLEPQIDLKHPEKNKEVTLNKANNIEWNLELKPAETKEVTLKYIVEHPANLGIYTEEVAIQG